MPQGSTGYFKLYLEPAYYGITSEIPDPKNNGFFMRFTVGEH